METPFIDHDTPDPDGVKPTGKLSRVAASILMKALYSARMCRYDLLKAIGHLASRITKWTSRCDKQLNRLVSYINTTADDVTLRGYIGDNPEDLWLELYSGADLASDKDSRKSTSGIFLALVGKHSFFPLRAISRKQGRVS